MGFWNFSVADFFSPWSSFRPPADTCRATAIAKVDPFAKRGAATMEAWKVKRLYYIEDFHKILTQVVNMLGEAVTACRAAAAQSTDGGAKIAATQQADQIEKSFLMKPSLVDGYASAQPFIEAYVAGVKGGKKAVASEDFKSWVGIALVELNKANATIAYADCRQSVGERVAAKLLAALGFVADVVVQMVEFVGDVANSVISVAMGAFKMFRYLKYGLYAAVIGGTGYLGYQGYKKVRARLPGRPQQALPAGDVDDEVA